MKRNSRPDPVRSKRILVWTLGGFVAIQLLAGLALDYVWPEIRFPHLQTMMENLESEPRSPDAMFLGSSRFQSSLNATELTHEFRTGLSDPNFRVFNAVVGASDCIAMEVELKRILDAGHRPRLVIMEMTPTTIARETPWYVTHLQRQIPWHETPRHFVELVNSGNLGRLVQARLIPLYRHRYETLKKIRRESGVFAPPAIHWVSSADQPRSTFTTEESATHLSSRPLTPEEIERSSKGVNDVRREVRRFAASSNALDSLDRMLARCQELGIQVVLVGAPVSSAYREAFEPIGDLYRQVLKEREERYGVRFFDTHAAVPDHQFEDYHHTTPTAGIAFSKLLARKLAPTVLSKGAD